MRVQGSRVKYSTNKASREGRGTRQAKTNAVPPASNPCGDDEGKRRV